MFRVLVALFWVSLIVGTLLAHSVVANWAVTLAALYFTAKWWSGRQRVAPSSTPPPEPTPANAGSAPPQTARATSTPASRPARSKWTVDRLHSAERPWR
jgi:hypothetical protein